MRARVLMVVVALVLGAAAAFATYGYLAGVRRQAEADSQTVPVLVAKQDLPRGASADELMKSGAIEKTRVPRRYVAAGALSTPASVSDRVLAVPVSKGEILTAQRFQYPSEAGLAFAVPKDLVAVTVPVDEARGLAGLVKPGDRVAVMATVGGSGNERTRITIPGARVLAVGRSTGVDKPNTAKQAQTTSIGGQTTQGGQVPMANVTLALSPADAEKVVFAAEIGEVWLALLPATQSAAPPGPGQTVSTVLE